MPHTFKRIPTFTREAINSAPSSLAELEINANQAAGCSDFLLEAEARFGDLTVQPSDWSREVQLRVKVAYLHLHPEGCTLSMKQYAGRDTIPNSQDWHVEVSEGSTTSVVKKDSDEKTGGVDFSPLTPKASGIYKSTNADESAKGSNTARKTSYTHTDYLFTRLTGNHWRIRDPRDRPLEGPAAPVDYFCKVEYEQPSGSITGYLKAYPRDIQVDVQHDGQWNHNLLKFSPRHKAVMNCLVAKHLRTLNPWGFEENADNRIRLARCNLTFRETVEPNQED